MPKKIRSVLLRYVLPVAVYGLILLTALGAQRFLSVNLDLTTLVIVLMIATAWYGGRWPGLLVALALEITLIYFTAGPLSWKLAFQVLNRLVLFGSVVLFASSRRAAERRLEQQREQLRVALTSIGDAVIATDINGHVNFINPTAEALTGWSLAEAANKPLDDVFKIINEATREPVESPVAKVLREGTVIGLANHTMLVARDGREIPIADSGAPIRTPQGRVTGVILVFRDVTDERRAEEASSLMASIVESSDDAIISKTLEGKIATWNKGAERLYGYSAEEVMGRSISLLMPPSRADDFPEIMERLKRGVHVEHFETQRMHKDGTIIDISLTVSPIRNSAGEITGASAIARDITGHKRSEKEREELLAREQSARREAEQATSLSAELLHREQSAREQAEGASRMKDEFLATVSHELRTPLNAILGWASVLQKHLDDRKTAAQAIGAIERNARAQTQLIEDLLDVSRIITGRMRLQVQPVDLLVVIRAAVEAISPAADAKGISLRLEPDPAAVTVSGDPARLQQVVWNLLSNSVKFTPRGGSVRVLLERAHSHMHITVSDTGKGISGEFLPYVFDRFRQADSSYSRVHAGLGLGLAIVRQLVELHGGTVEAQSAGEGYGASFTVTLPIAAGKEATQNAAGALEPD
jgi:PAS domain S-box-containing protein